MTEDIEKLDNDWINEFEYIDTSYNKFYKESVDFVGVTYVYIGKEGEIVHVKKEKIILRPQNILPYNVLMDLIQTHKIEKLYKFDFLIKYNITLDPNDIKYITKNGIHDNFIYETSRLDNVKFENTISMFQDLNEIIIFYSQNTQNKTNNNKTIKLNPYKTKNNMSLGHKKTKKSNVEKSLKIQG